MRKLFGAAILVVIALGALAVAVPAPVSQACLFCVPIGDCPPCTQLSRGSCFKCPSCVAIPGCKH